jgi:hypothetical protein
MSHITNFWERMIKYYLRKLITISKNQFSFMHERSTIKIIFLIKQFMERYHEQKKDSHMIFIDLEKIYDKISRNIMW